MDCVLYLLGGVVLGLIVPILFYWYQIKKYEDDTYG